MNMPGEILDLWIRFHLWNGGRPLKLGYLETYTLEKLRDAADDEKRNRILERLENKYKACSQLFIPICAGGPPARNIRQNQGINEKSEISARSIRQNQGIGKKSEISAVHPPP